jgi:hypothetical protein
MGSRHKAGWVRTTAAAGVLGSCVAAVGGCAALGVFAKAYQDATPITVKAKYTGLDGHDFAVVVTADRIIKADFPGVVPMILVGVSGRLAEHTEATGWVPPDGVLRHLSDNPRWDLRPRSELAANLGVNRLVFIELHEFRLNEPGNRHLWSGLASGRVAVYETDSPLPDDAAFEETVIVSFPDADGFGEQDLTTQQITSVLLRRFVDRSSWLFYTHKEDRNLKY